MRLHGLLVMFMSRLTFSIVAAPKFAVGVERHDVVAIYVAAVLGTDPRDFQVIPLIPVTPVTPVAPLTSLSGINRATLLMTLK